MIATEIGKSVGIYMKKYECREDCSSGLVLNGKKTEAGEFPHMAGEP